MEIFPPEPMQEFGGIKDQIDFLFIDVPKKPRLQNPWDSDK